MSRHRHRTTLITRPTSPPKLDGRHARGHVRQRAQIDAARELFLAQGYRGTTLEAIIARAGGSRETIYRVFGGKRGLFGAVVAGLGERLAASVVEPDALGLPPREGLTRFACDLVAIWQSDEGRAVNRVVLSEGADAPEIVDAWYKGGTKLSIAALAAYLETKAEAGQLLALDAERVARQFVILLMGEMAFPLIASDMPPEPAADRIARCVELVLRAYAPALLSTGSGPA